MKRERNACASVPETAWRKSYTELVFHMIDWHISCDEAVAYLNDKLWLDSKGGRKCAECNQVVRQIYPIYWRCDLHFSGQLEGGAPHTIADQQLPRVYWPCVPGTLRGQSLHALLIFHSNCYRIMFNFTCQN